VATYAAPHAPMLPITQYISKYNLPLRFDEFHQSRYWFKLI